MESKSLPVYVRIWEIVESCFLSDPCFEFLQCYAVPEHGFISIYEPFFQNEHRKTQV